MSIPEIYNQFIEGIKQTTALEYIAVFAGIASVLFSRLENILVYPTGLINTILYTYFCYAWWGLYAEASLNFYYTVMSIYGWIVWARVNKNTDQKELSITSSNKKEWILAIAFFIVCWIGLFFFLKSYTTSTVPIADSFASAAAYTGMLLMARKKLENWLWWILTNIASIPLYFYKHAVFTSVQYSIFLILAVIGYITWKKKLKNERN